MSPFSYFKRKKKTIFLLHIHFRSRFKLLQNVRQMKKKHDKQGVPQLLLNILVDLIGRDRDTERKGEIEREGKKNAENYPNHHLRFMLFTIKKKKKNLIEFYENPMRTIL